MKSGPTLAEATRMPRLAKAAINPVATVVFPTPEWVPEMTMRGPSVGTPHPATGRAPARRRPHTPAARGKRIVSHSTLPTGALPAEVDRLVSESLDGGTPIYRLDHEAIRELRPDVVITQDLCAVCAVPSGHVHEALDLLGCPAEVVSLDPSSLDEVLNSVVQVGRV